jgi:transposase-like protein
LLIDHRPENIDDLFRLYDFPDAHRKSIRSRNIVERVKSEVRRRTRVMYDCADTVHGCNGIVMGVIREQNERWGNRSYRVIRFK